MTHCSGIESSRGLALGGELCGRPPRVKSVGGSGCCFVSSNTCAVKSTNPSRHSHWVSDTGLHVLPQPPARCSNGAVGLPVWILDARVHACATSCNTNSPS